MALRTLNPKPEPQAQVEQSLAELRDALGKFGEQLRQQSWVLPGPRVKGPLIETLWPLIVGIEGRIEGSLI